MSVLFDDLKEGLEQAIGFEKGNGPAKSVTYTILPAKHYTNTEIRDIRMKAGMTQAIFSAYFGVSPKTVEAWENGRTHPTGPACRLLGLLEAKSIPPFVELDKRAE